MARLPAPEDIQRARMPANTPGVSLKTPDYGPMVTAGKSMAEGMNKLGQGFEAVVSMNDQVDDYETKKKLLDFQLNAEMALEERKRSMPVGAQGYADGWQNEFKAMAADLVGKNDANIPASQRLKVGLALKRIDTQLAERATRDQFAEQDRFELDGLNETTNRLRGAVEADPARLEEMRNEGRSLIEVSRLTPAAKHKALQVYDREIEKTYFISRMSKVKTKDELEALKQELGPDLPDKVRGPGRPSKAGGLADNTDYSNASGKDITRGIYQAFRNLGYTDFGAKTMVAEVHREHGGEFSREHGSRRPFGFEWEPAPEARGQVNFGFINSAGKRTDEIIAALEKEGLVSYDAPKSRMNPKGIRVENSQKALDVMANWYDQDLANNGARDKNAIIRGADPKELPALFRDESYNDVHDAHRRTAAWIQWQHPEIYGGRYRNGIAGQKHYDAMMGNRRNLDNLLSDVSGPSEGDPNAPGYEGPGRRLSITERRTLWNQAQTDWAKQVAGIGKEIENFEKVAGDGYNLPDGVLGDLQKRVEASGDPTLQNRFRATLGLAAESQRLQQMPPPLLEQYTQNLRRNAGEKGITADQQKYIEHAEKVSATVRKNTSEDPLSWAQRTGIKLPIVASAGPDAFTEPVKLEQMNFGAKDIDAVLARRMEQAKIVGSYYGQEPQAFTKIERDALKSTLKQGGDAMLYVMGKIAKSAGEAGIPPEQVMKEFTKDAPEVAMIGDLVANNADKALLDTAAKALAFKTSQKENFKPTIDRAQVKLSLGDYAEALSTQPTKVDAARDTAALIYEYEARQKGLTEFKEDVYKDVVGRVMGKVTTHDGLSFGGVGKQGAGYFDGKWQTQVLVPPGIRTDKFDDMVGALRSQDLAYTGTPRDSKGQPLSVDEVRRATWVSVGPAQYALKTGLRADGRPIYAGDDRGEPFVLDARKIMDPLRRRVPEIFMGYDGIAKGVPEVLPPQP